VLNGDESSHGAILSYDTPEPHITRRATKRKKQGTIGANRFHKGTLTEGKNMAGKFDLETYETVESRLVKFWKDHKTGRVFTELVFHDERRFIVRAEIYFDKDDLYPTATGYAEEIVGASPVNRTSALENGETSSIGRALANCGYASQGKRASREEMEKVQRYQDEPRKAPKSKEAKVYTPEQIAAAAIAITEVQIAQNIAEARRIWDTNKDLLDVPVDGTTLKDALNTKAAQLQ
jgi:hypothetical protein